MKLNSWVASAKLDIPKERKMSRLKFSTEHIVLTEDEWDCVPFSYESKFYLFCSDG